MKTIVSFVLNISDVWICNKKIKLIVLEDDEIKLTDLRRFIIFGGKCYVINWSDFLEMFKNLNMIMNWQEEKKELTIFWLKRR